MEKRKHSVFLTSTGEACVENYLDTPRDATVAIGERNNDKITKTKDGSSPESQSKNYKNPINKDVVIPTLYDVVILDYKMPGMNGMDVAKEILAVNPHQRIIFASAYVKETLQESVKELNK